MLPKIELHLVTQVVKAQIMLMFTSITLSQFISFKNINISCSELLNSISKDANDLFSLADLLLEK